MKSSRILQFNQRSSSGRIYICPGIYETLSKQKFILFDVLDHSTPQECEVPVLFFDEKIVLRFLLTKEAISKCAFLVAINYRTASVYKSLIYDPLLKMSPRNFINNHLPYCISETKRFNRQLLALASIK